MLKHPLLAEALGQLEAWLVGNGARYADGTSPHAVHYAPASWSGIRCSFVT